MARGWLCHPPKLVMHPKLITSGLLHFLLRAWLIAGPCHILLMSNSSVLVSLLSCALSFVTQAVGILSDLWKSYFQVHSFFLLFWCFFLHAEVREEFARFHFPSVKDTMEWCAWAEMWQNCGSEKLDRTIFSGERSGCPTEDDYFLCRPLMGPWHGLKEKTIS